MKLFAPILSTYRAYANMTRIRKILGVVFRNGLGIFFGKLRHLVRRRERNDGSSAELTIQERVRKVLEELGLAHTHFANPHGLSMSRSDRCSPPGRTSSGRSSPPN